MKKHDMVPAPKELTVWLGHQDTNEYKVANDKDDKVCDRSSREGERQHCWLKHQREASYKRSNLSEARIASPKRKGKY